MEKRLVEGGIVAVKGGRVDCRVEKKLAGQASKLLGRHPSCREVARPNQSCVFPYRKIDINKMFYLSFSKNISNHVPEIFILQNLILRTRSCGIGFITQYGWFFHFHLTTLVRWKCFVPQLYQFRRGISGGPALKYFYIIHRGRLATG